MQIPRVAFGARSAEDGRAAEARLGLTRWPAPLASAPDAAGDLADGSAGDGSASDSAGDSAVETASPAAARRSAGGNALRAAKVQASGAARERLSRTLSNPAGGFRIDVSVFLRAY